MPYGAEGQLHTMSQKNGKAILVKANGDRVQPATQAAIETVTALRPEIGLALRESILNAINLPSANVSDSAEDKGANFSEAKLQLISKAHTDKDELIKALRAKITGWQNEGAKQIDTYIKDFNLWCLGLAPTTNEDGTALMLDVLTPEGVRISLPAKEAVSGTVSYYLYQMLELSNMAFLGQMGKVGKNGKRKSPKKSIFENDKRSATSEEGKGGNENWGVMASANYRVNHGEAGNDICKAIELIAVCAKYAHNDMPEESQKQFKILTGQIKDDKRFNFDPKMIEAFVVARCYGLLVSAAKVWIKDLKESQHKSLVNISWLNKQDKDVEKLVDDLARNKAFKENHPEETPEGLQVSPEQMTGVTLKSKAERRIRKIAASYDRGVSDEEMPLMLDDLQGSIEFDEESFNENFSEENIKLYFEENIIPADAKAEQTETVTA